MLRRLFVNATFVYGQELARLGSVPNQWISASAMLRKHLICNADTQVTWTPVGLGSALQQTRAATCRRDSVLTIAVFVESVGACAVVLFIHWRVAAERRGGAGNLVFT